MQENHETRLLSFLQDPESYPDAVDEVVIKQTHISMVAIVRPYVYKFKKSVNFGFLDYSTLEKRKKFCEEEVKVNRRLSSGVYLDVVALYEENGRFNFNSGEIVDYAVKMKYLPEKSNLLGLILKREVYPEHVSALALRMENFYTETGVSRLSAQDYFEEISHSVLENFPDLKKHVPAIFDGDSVDLLERYSRAFLKERRDDLMARSAAGLVKDCHGDLRAEHVYFQDPERPEPKGVFVIDAIEFNREFREIDTLNDLAFLLMDLDFNNAATTGARFLKEVTAHMNDHPPPGLVTFYKIYRALVRAKVQAMRASEDEVPENERKESKERASSFVRLATRYLACGDSPLAIVVMGKSGTGKSVFSKRLCELTGLPHLSSDVARKEYLGMAPGKPIPENRKKEVYSPEAKHAIYESLLKKADESLNSSFGAVIDATFSSAVDRARLRDFLDATAKRYLFIELFCDDSVGLLRLEKRRSENSHGSDARAGDKKMLDALYESPLEIPENFLVRVDTGSPEEPLKQLFSAILQRRY